MNVFQQYDAEVFGRYSVTNHLIAVAAEKIDKRPPDDVRLRQKEARARAASGEKNPGRRKKRMPAPLKTISGGHRHAETLISSGKRAFSRA